MHKIQDDILNSFSFSSFANQTFCLVSAINYQCTVMSLGLEDLLPSEDTLLFKEPQPVPLPGTDLGAQDSYPNLDIPDFSNFSIEDVDFGDLEFLDLATAPLERTKRSNPGVGDMYFNSLATPSGHCSANFLTEEANRLSCLFQDKEDRGEGLEKGLLENLEELFSSPGTEEKAYIGPRLGVPADSEYEVPSEVLTLMAKNFESLQEELEADGEADQKESECRQITIKSVRPLGLDDPPAGTVAKIIIRSNKSSNSTSFTFSSLDGRESHSFRVATSNVKCATQALRPLALDSVGVIRKLLRLGPLRQPAVRETKPPAEIDEKVGRLGLTATTDTETSIKTALLQHGIKVESLVRLTLNSGQKFWCCPEPDCQKAYVKGHELKLHILGHYNVKPFQCQLPDCGWSFVTKNKLMRHMASHTKERAFTCNVQGCEKKFSTIYNLNSHLKLHERTFLFSCANCEDKFQTERELQLHVRKEHREEVAPPLGCPMPDCEKTYYTKSTLDAHIRSHANVPSLKCDICFKKFDKPSRLKQHMVFHTGEKPFPCDFPNCSWRFPTSSKLARHRRTHTNERRHTCTACGKAFGRTEHLAQHVAIHDKEGEVKGVDCPIEGCARVYPTTGDLRSHMCSAHGADDHHLEGEEVASTQLDFVALLSSVGEEVITAELGAEEGLLQLVQVESENVEVVNVGEWTALQGEPDANLISAGLVTLDADAISSSPGSGGGASDGLGRKRRASGQAGRGGKAAKRSPSQESTINLQDLE